ncbi:MAG: flagellar hook-basal body complex protein [Clostridium sp.]
MYTLLSTSKSSMMAQQNKLDILSNNINNVNTTGYKRLDVQFEDLYQESLNRNGMPITEGKNNLTYGTGVRSGKVVRQFFQGSLQETGSASHLAIDGKGLFKVYTADGNAAYTRAGSFSVDAAGNLADGNGNRISIVDGNGNEVNYPGGPINLQGGEFNIDKNGKVLKRVNGDFVELGQIKTYDVVGDTSLMSIGENLYVPLEGSEMYETTDRNILQGYLENSNVDIGQEMSDMILTQRAFSLGSSALKTADEMWGMINSVR